MNIAYFAHGSWEQSFIEPLLSGHTVQFFSGPIQGHEAEIHPETEVLCVFVNSPVTSELIDSLPKLKLIATRSTGFDHIANVHAKEKGITVSTVPAYGQNTVAEFAFALLLSLSRKVCEAKARVQSGSFEQGGLEGFDLAGKTMGIVGCGRIGSHAAAIAKGFDMRVLAWDAIENQALAEKIGYTYVTLPEILTQSDVLSIHVPYMDATHHLINMDTVQQIKKGCYLINTARGPVVQSAALVHALNSDIIAGAGLDVLEGEQYMGTQTDDTQLQQLISDNTYLIQHPKVLVTPHIGYDSREALQRILTTTVENINAFAAGTPQNTI